LTEGEFKGLMSYLKQSPSVELNPEKLADMIDKTPTAAALGALVEASQDIYSPIRVRAARLAARCYGKGGDAAVMGQVLVTWAREPLDEWRSIFDEFAKHGHDDVVALAVQQLIESASEKDFESHLRLAEGLLQRDPKHGAWLGPALLRSYAGMRNPSPQRRALIAKCKTETALVEAIGMYAKEAANGRGSERLGSEFTDVLKALMDKRGVKFMLWVAFEKRETEMWPMSDLRRVTGQSTGPDADVWQKWYKSNESKLPKQIVTAEMK
jgi:hypothetical protein